MSIETPTQPAPENSHPEHSPVRRWLESTRSIALVALAIAVIATGLAIAAWVRPWEGNSFSDRQSAQAKANVCSAWAPVREAVWVGTPNPNPGDPIAQLSVAANVRLAMLGGGAYLRETLAAEPATPADLAKAVNSAANTLEKMGINYLARANETVIDPLMRDLNVKGAQIDKLCK